MNQLVFENIPAMLRLVVTIGNEGYDKRDNRLVPMPVPRKSGVLIRANPALEFRQLTSRG